jgi:hypothetical protein
VCSRWSVSATARRGRSNAAYGPTLGRQRRGRAGRGASAKAVGAVHRLPCVCSLAWPVAQLTARAWGALRSNKCDEYEHDARLRARPRGCEQTQARSLDRCAAARPTPPLQETHLVFVCNIEASTGSARTGEAIPAAPPRGRRCPAGAISVAAVMLGLGPERACAHRELTRRGCPSGGASGPVASSATPVPGRAARRSRRAATTVTV